MIPQTHRKETNVLGTKTSFKYLAAYGSTGTAQKWPHSTYLSKSAFS